MTPCQAAILESRGVVTVSGEDRSTFLQGLISNDIRRARNDTVIYASLLTPQGKYLHDFFIFSLGDSFFLDCERGRVEDLITTLNRYRLRSKVAIQDRSATFAVAALWGEGVPRAIGLSAAPAGAAIPWAQGIAGVDPRLPAAGVRALMRREDAATALATANFERASMEAYDLHRLGLGLPDGSRDMIVGRSLLLEGNLDKLNAIDWHKGCYLGQELTARTRYRGLIKKAMIPLRVIGPSPAPDTKVLAAGVEVGQTRSCANDLAMAFLAKDMIVADPPPLTAGETPIVLVPPAWMKVHEN